MKKQVWLGFVVLLVLTYINLGLTLPSIAAGTVTSGGSSGTKSVVSTAGESKNARGNLYPAYVLTGSAKKWGYIDEQGKFIIQPTFNSAEEFESNGLAKVGQGQYYGVIDRTGKYILKPRYLYISPWIEGRATCAEPNGSFLVDEKGQVIFKTDGDFNKIQNGRVAFYRASKNGESLYGYVDLKGKVIVEPMYKTAEEFSEGKALVQLKTGTFALIDLTGKTLATFNYPFVGGYREHMLIFRKTQGGKCGYIDEKGKVLIEPQFGEAQEFTGGLTVVNASQDYEQRLGVINKKGQFIVKPDYADIKILSNGFLALGKSLSPDIPTICKFAIADRTGKLLTDFNYYDIGDYQDKLLSVSDETSTFFLTEGGKQSPGFPVIKGIGVMRLFGKVIAANIDNQFVYFERTGRVIWQEESTFALHGGASVQAVKYRANHWNLVRYPELAGLKNTSVQQSVNQRLKDIFLQGYLDKKFLDEEHVSNNVTFNISYVTPVLLVLGLENYSYGFGAAHGMPVQEYYHIDLNTGKFYELGDLFKKNVNYLKTLTDIVQRRIETNGEEMGLAPAELKDVRVKDSQPFILDKESFKLYYDVYEIGPYVAGFPTFAIKYAEVMHLIDIDGSLWKAIIAR